MKLGFLVLAGASCVVACGGGGSPTAPVPTSGPAITAASPSSTPTPTVAVSPTFTPLQTVNIFGTVTGKDVVGTTIPVAGILVTCQGIAAASGPTSGSGDYEIRGLVRGQTLVTATAVGSSAGEWATTVQPVTLSDALTRVDIYVGPVIVH
jgi:hypothetical protein